ncbi:GNAT family N-acetyltransferase [filamentous cyanobacterium CCP5]|nr:GNAT family N-acetyltransferase [filamentous cyanobacterium CCP5]
MVADIRTATVADLPAILDIYNHAILTTTAVYDYAPHTLEMRQQWYDAKQADGLPVVVAVVAAQVVGFGALSWFRAWAAYQHTVENSIYIAPSHHGQGIGKQLLRELIDQAKQRQMHTIVAGIDAENIASQKLHQGLGFEPVGRFRQVGYKFDRWLDLIFWQLMLSD